jgi:hypothetical protein
MMYFVIAIIVVAAILWLLWQQKLAYYRKIFNDEHYEQVARWVASCIDMGDVERPSMANGSGIVTNGGVTIGFSRKSVPERDQIHFSISERRGLTTHSVGEKMNSLIMEMLSANSATADCFYTTSGAHHIVLEKDADQPWRLSPISQVVANMKEHRDVPLRFDDTSYITPEMREALRHGKTPEEIHPN